MPSNAAQRQAAGFQSSCALVWTFAVQEALPAPCPPLPACTGDPRSKQRIKPSCVRSGAGGAADIWARARPTYRIIPGYVRQLFILTWCAAGAGQKAHTALHLPLPALLRRRPPGNTQHLSRCLAAGLRSTAQHPHRSAVSPRALPAIARHTVPGSPGAADQLVEQPPTPSFTHGVPTTGPGCSTTAYYQDFLHPTCSLGHLPILR